MLFYLIVYLFMNLGAFAVVAVLRNLTHSEDLADFRGMIYRNPARWSSAWPCSCSACSACRRWQGSRPSSRYSACCSRGPGSSAPGAAGPELHPLRPAGDRRSQHGLSLFYYVKVLKVMILDQPLEAVENRPVAQLPTPAVANAYLVVLASALSSWAFSGTRCPWPAPRKGVSSLPSDAATRPGPACGKEPVDGHRHIARAARHRPPREPIAAAICQRIVPFTRRPTRRRG